MKPTLLILAAGIGSRYGGLKQAEGVGPSGEAILDYSIYDALNAGFSKIIFVIRRDIEEDMRNIFFNKWENKIEIDYVFQELEDLPGLFTPPHARTKPWGTGHAIWSARNKIAEPFAVINADDFYGRDSHHLAGGFLSDINNLVDGRYCLIGFILKNTLSEHGFVSRAECTVDDDNNLTQIIERLKIKRIEDSVLYEDSEKGLAKLSEETIVSMNLWGFMPSFFDHLEHSLLDFLKLNHSDNKAEFLLPTVVNHLVTSGEVEVLVLQTTSKWFGMTYLEDRKIVRERLAELVHNGVYPSPVWK